MEMHYFILVGFIAQLIDGSLGMAYGVCSTTILSIMGIPIKIASASVHTAEVFTTLISGISHWKARNIDWVIFKKLVILGSIGGLIGTFVLAFSINDFIQPVVNVYLIIMGIKIISRAIINKKMKENPPKNQLLQVGFFGGCLDALGGGGWGPIVTSTMVATGYPTRYTIGSVNLAEFFVTLVQSFSFSLFVGIEEYFHIIVGLAIGGCLAAPLAAYMCKRVPEKKTMLIVGILIILLNLENLLFLF